MSGADYQSGLGAGYAVARRVRNDASAAIDEWSSFSAKLENRLLRETVERQVSVDYVKELRKALRELAPDHPLLQEEKATKIFEHSRTEAYRRSGYDYNAATGSISKKNTR